MRACGSPHPTSGPVRRDLAGLDPDGDYGYYWWIKPNGTFLAEGRGGQVIQVVEAMDLVVVITADPYSDVEVLGVDLWDIPDRVMDAVVTP